MRGDPANDSMHMGNQACRHIRAERSKKKRMTGIVFISSPLKYMMSEYRLSKRMS